MSFFLDNDPTSLVAIFVPISVIIAGIMIAVGIILRKRRSAAKPERRVSLPVAPTESSEYYTMPFLGAPQTADTLSGACNIPENQGITGSQYEVLDLTDRSRGHEYLLLTNVLHTDHDAKTYEELNLSGRDSNEGHEYASVSATKERVYVNLNRQE